MTLDALIMLAGGFVAVLPFLGFPNSWDSILLVLVGVILIGLGIAVRQRIGPDVKIPRESETFVENGPRHEA